MSINREVAEAIGYRVERWDYTRNHCRQSGDVYVPRDAPPKHEEWNTTEVFWGQIKYAVDWKPDTDLNAAMEAMSKLCRDSKDKILECGLEYEMTGDGWRYFAYIREAGIGINDFYAEGDTPALAICHAILAAKGKR